MKNFNQPSSADHLFAEVLKLNTGELEQFVQKLSELANNPVIEHAEMTEEHVSIACTMYELRRLRNRFLSANILGEPVWDMLLALYCFTARREALSITGLCHAANVPSTTALRWVKLMEQKGMVTRRRDKNDARRIFLVLTTFGKEMMTNYLSAAHSRITASSEARIVRPTFLETEK